MASKLAVKSLILAIILCPLWADDFISGMVLALQSYGFARFSEDTVAIFVQLHCP